MKKRTRNIIGILVILSVLAFLITSSIINSYKYYHTVDEVALKLSEFTGKDIKLAGSVKKGSVLLRKSESGCDFVIVGEKAEIPVSYRGQVPDTFKDEIPVVVEGRIKEDGSFRAEALLTKCASKYEEKLN